MTIARLIDCLPRFSIDTRSIEGHRLSPLKAIHSFTTSTFASSSGSSTALRSQDGSKPAWLGGLDLDDNLFAVGPIRQIRDCGEGAEDLVPFGFEPVSDLRGLERRRGSGPWSRAPSGAGLLGLGSVLCGTFFRT